MRKLEGFAARDRRKLRDTHYDSPGAARPSAPQNDVYEHPSDQSPKGGSDVEERQTGSGDGEGDQGRLAVFLVSDSRHDAAEKRTEKSDRGDGGHKGLRKGRKDGHKTSTSNADE